MIQLEKAEFKKTHTKRFRTNSKRVLNTLKVGLKTILIPTDCSDHSRISVKYGIQLAKENDAEIKLLYIQENVDIDKEKNKQSNLETQDLRMSQLQDFWDSFEEELPCEREVRTGDVVSEVIYAAKKGAFDLIIMSSHGYKGLVYSMKGSTTEKVTRYAPCPVLCVKNEGRQIIQ